MSCLTVDITPEPQSLKVSVPSVSLPLEVVFALVCGSSLGTTELLYADGSLLLDSDGKVFAMPKN